MRVIEVLRDFTRRGWYVVKFDEKVTKEVAQWLRSLGFADVHPHFGDSKAAQVDLGEDWEYGRSEMDLMRLVQGELDAGERQRETAAEAPQNYTVNERQTMYGGKATSLVTVSESLHPWRVVALDQDPAIEAATRREGTKVFVIAKQNVTPEELQRIIKHHFDGPSGSREGS